MTLTVKTIMPIVLAIGFGVFLLLLPQWIGKRGLVVSNSRYVNQQFNYQMGLLTIAGISILATYLLNGQNFTIYFSFGQLSAIGEELRWLGIRQGDTWMKTGLSLCVTISFITAVFLYFQLRRIHPNWSALRGAIFWIVLFSLTNSFGEEMIFRLGIVSPLSGQLAPTSIFLISAVLFGIPHFAGMPNGITGMLLAGVLGFVLAKSMYETQGFFWAWLIHFLQDLFIFSTLYLLHRHSGS